MAKIKEEREAILENMEEQRAILDEAVEQLGVEAQRADVAGIKLAQIRAEVIRVGNRLRGMEICEKEGLDRISATDSKRNGMETSMNEKVKQALYNEDTAAKLEKVLDAKPQELVDARKRYHALKKEFTALVAEMNGVEPGEANSLAQEEELLDEERIKLAALKRAYETAKFRIEINSSKADALEEQVEMLGETVAMAVESADTLEGRKGESSLKEERNAEELLLLEGQCKEADVRIEVATRCCQVTERNMEEYNKLIKEWVDKAKPIQQELKEMNDDNE